MRRILALLSSAVLAAGLYATTLPWAAQADVPANVANYTSLSYATGVHQMTFGAGFNFPLVDNHYPLARVTQDHSPLADAIGTYSDTGPFTQTLGSAVNSGCQNGTPPPPPGTCQNPNSNVPYANAHYPGGKDKDHVDSCSAAPGGGGSGPCTSGSYSDVTAGELVATANSYYAGGGTSPFSGGVGETSTKINPDGSLTVTSHSLVKSATFGAGAGAISIRNSEVTITVVIAGGQVTTSNVEVKPGDVNVGGKPVTVTDQGITVTEQTPIPCPTLPPAPPGPAGLPVPVPTTTGCAAGVQTDYYKLYTVKPDKQVSGNHAVISASGLHMTVTHPQPNPAVPQQTTEYVFAEGYINSVLDSQAAAAGGDTSGDGGAVLGTGGDSGYMGDAGGYADPSGALGSMDGGTGTDATANAPAPAKATKPRLVSLLRADRQPLALLFLFWECLVMVAAAALIWARRRPELALADEEED